MLKLLQTKRGWGGGALEGLSVVIYVAEGNVHSCCMRHTSRLLNNRKGDVFFNAISNSQILLCGACIVWTEKLGRVKKKKLTTPKNIISTVRPILFIFHIKHTSKRKVFVNMGGYSFVLISMFIYLHKWPNNVCSLSHYSHMMYVVIYI